MARYIHTKEEEAAYDAIRQYCMEHQPTMVTGAKEGEHSETMRAFLHGDVCEQREMLLGTALLLKQLAELQMDTATLESAAVCMKLLPLAVRWSY